jgi:hypothetical protein
MGELEIWMSAELLPWRVDEWTERAGRLVGRRGLCNLRVRAPVAGFGRVSPAKSIQVGHVTERLGSISGLLTAEGSAGQGGTRQPRLDY